MPEKDLNNYVSLQYIWVPILSILGTIVSYAAKVKRGESSWSNIREVVGEQFTGVFVGVVTFFACEASGFQPLWTAVMVSITSQMGSRAIDLFETMLKKFLEKRMGK